MDEKKNPLSWLVSTSETAHLLRSIDWESSSLGAPQTWPAGLKTSINFCLEAKFPMYIWWGPDCINIYNDAYIALAGYKKHPTFFGRPAREMWAEIWDTLQDFIQEVRLTGSAILHEDLLLPLQRQHQTEEAYFTFSYGPLRDDQGEIQGIQCICFETTGKIMAQRRMQEALATSENLTTELREFFNQAPVPMAILFGPDHRFTLANPHYERLVGGRSAVGKTVSELFSTENIAPFIDLLDGVYRTGIPFIGKEILLSIADEAGEFRDHWLNFSYHPFKGDQNEIKGILVSATDVTDQVLSRQKIAESDQYFRTIANFMPQIVWTANPEGKLDYFNDVWFTYSGSIYADNEGDGWVKFVHPDDQAQMAEKWLKALQEVSEYHVEFRLRRVDGVYRWHIGRAYPSVDASGKTIKWIGTNTDIHDAKSFTFELESEKLKFETLFADASTSLALLRGADMIFEKANPSYMDLFSGRVKIGSAILELMPELKDQAFAKLLMGVFETGVPYREEEAHAYLRRSHDSPLEERYFRQSYSQVKDAAGNPYGVFIHAIEITDAVLARQQLEASQRKMNFAIEAAQMGTWHIDLKTMDVTTSDEFMKIFDFGFVGGNIFEEISRLMHPEDVAAVNDIWLDSVKNKTPYIHEYRIKTKSGEVKWVHSRGQAIYDVDGTPLYLSGVLMDITNKKLADEKLATLTHDLRLAVSTRDEFLSVASHELKTPLTSMKLQVQSMKRNIDKNRPDALEKEKVMKLLTGTDRQISTLIRLVDDMLDISRLQSGNLSMQAEFLSLKEIISDIYEQLEEQILRSGCNVTCHLSNEATGLFDRARVGQVITNLMTNALRYGDGRPVEIHLSVNHQVAHLKVIDHGIGISPENFEKVFGRFERLDSSSSIRGLGLGLYITKKIVEAHGGKIWVESTVGEGSTFHVDLPLS